ncbi:hypothetical protein K501DRAFT_289263 [Backusella circina FSU 941]|nr:hypothetical protein K501DRAFT_289263 [Backusella circina FSU 941]
MSSSNYNKKPRKKKVHPHNEYLQELIDTLKAELSEIKQLEIKQDALTQQEEDMIAKKSTKEAHLEQTMTIFDKLNETVMINRSLNYYETERKKKGEEQVLSILHFFYIVRLGQQGLFSIIAQVAPLVDIDSLTNICDQLVGTSLYAAKDPIFNNRPKHKAKLFDIIHKLENGLDEPVCKGADTTFKQVKDLVDHILKNTKDEKTVIQHYSKLLKHGNNEQTSPTWIVMPYQSMMMNLSSQINLKKEEKEKSSNLITKDKVNVKETKEESREKEEPSLSKDIDSKKEVLDETKGDDLLPQIQEQEETKRSADVDEHNTDKQVSSTPTLASSESVQYNSESDNWRQRNTGSDGNRQPRGRGRGGRGHGRGASSRGSIRGSRGRGQGKRPRGAHSSKNGSGEEQNNTSHYPDAQTTTRTTITTTNNNNTTTETTT